MAVPSVDSLGSDRSLLMLDQDEGFLRRLGRAMERRGCWEYIQAMHVLCQRILCNRCRK